MDQAVFEIRRMFMDMCTVPEQGMTVSVDSDERGKKAAYVYRYIPEKNECEWVPQNNEGPLKSSSDSLPCSDTSTEDEFPRQELKEEEQTEKVQKRKNTRRNVLLMELLHIQDALQKNNVQKASDLLDNFIKQHAHKIVEIKNKEKKTRVKTSYNTFISNTLLKLKNECPHVSPPMRMRIAVSKWHELCQANDGSASSSAPSFMDTT